MNSLHWKILIATAMAALLIEMSCAQWNSYKSPFIKDSDNEKDSKPKPYEFNDAELTAIQAIVAFREVIGELLQKVGIGWPSLGLSDSTASSGKPTIPRLPSLSSSGDDDITSSTATKASGGLGAALIRGVALSLPLLIPMATTIRRMSNDPYVPQLPSLPFLPDPYYNSAMHRRRGRSLLSRRSDDDNITLKLKYLESVLSRINELSRKYDNP